MASPFTPVGQAFVSAQIGWAKPIAAVAAVAAMNSRRRMCPPSKDHANGSTSLALCRGAVGGERTARGPDCVKTFFLPQKQHATGDDPRRHDGLSIFLLDRVRSQPGRKLGPR